MPIQSGRLYGLAAAAVVLGLAGCGGNPATPTPPASASPTITCPANQTVQATTGNAISVQYASPTVVNGTAPVVTTCAPASGSAFSVGQTAVTCTATDALRRADTCGFSITVLQVPMLAATSMVAFGDSITWGENGVMAASARGSVQWAPWPAPQVQVPASDTYPEVLRQELAQRYTTQTPTVANAGLTGEAVTDKTTFPRFVSYSSSGKYDVVLIMEGTNDLADRDATIEPAVIAGLRDMIDDARSRGMRAYLATIPPQDPSGIRGLAASLVPGFNDRVRALALAEQVPLVDVYNALNTDVPAYIGWDGVHPTVLGYAKIAETFFASIQNTLEVRTSPAPGAAAALAPPGIDDRGTPLSGQERLPELSVTVPRRPASGRVPPSGFGTPASMGGRRAIPR